MLENCMQGFLCIPSDIIKISKIRHHSFILQTFEVQISSKVVKFITSLYYVIYTYDFYGSDAYANYK